jgi:hypothetical protein
MMLVKIKRRSVDVLELACRDRECFVLGFDKGTFAPGRGYTSYHTDGKGRRVERPVCATRHYHGCPSNSVCSVCRVVDVLPPGVPCRTRSCSGMLVARDPGNVPAPGTVCASVENIQFEITHDRIIAIIANQLGLKAEQIDLKPLTADEDGAVFATVRTDLATANKIDRKIKRLEGGDSAPDNAPTDAVATE